MKMNRLELKAVCLFGFHTQLCLTNLKVNLITFLNGSNRKTVPFTVTSCYCHLKKLINIMVDTTNTLKDEIVQIITLLFMAPRIIKSKNGSLGLAEHRGHKVG